MRIISGIFKGKKIIEPQDFKTRPLKDLTKESIFNIIAHSNKFSIDLKNAEILDLFSGTGSFGIECLSREAKHVTFVENYNGILPILRKNLLSLKSILNYQIIEQDILQNFNFKNLDKKFDIIFLDPPFKENDLTNLITLLIDYKILATQGIMIIHRHSKQQDVFPNTFKIIDQKKYGLSRIIFGSAI
jgi:16S rRNA (guanine966-N2)-methyltransferase